MEDDLLEALKEKHSEQLRDLRNQIIARDEYLNNRDDRIKELEDENRRLWLALGILREGFGGLYQAVSVAEAESKAGQAATHAPMNGALEDARTTVVDVGRVLNGIVPLAPADGTS